MTPLVLTAILSCSDAMKVIGQYSHRVPDAHAWCEVVENYRQDFGDKAFFARTQLLSMSCEFVLENHCQVIYE